MPSGKGLRKYRERVPYLKQGYNRGPAVQNRAPSCGTLPMQRLFARSSRRHVCLSKSRVVAEVVCMRHINERLSIRVSSFQTDQSTRIHNCLFSLCACFNASLSIQVCSSINKFPTMATVNLDETKDRWWLPCPLELISKQRKKDIMAAVLHVMVRTMFETHIS